jgi:tetratricopeptide (TPR) repeat protein
VRVIDQLPDLYREVAADSADASARYRLGVVLTSLGGFDDAVGHLTAALSLDSTRAEYWRALGRAAFFNREHSRSLESYWNALRLDPAAIGEGGIDRMAFDAALELTLRRDEGRR